MAVTASSLFATAVILLMQAAFALWQIRFVRSLERLIGVGRAGASPSLDVANAEPST